MSTPFTLFLHAKRIDAVAWQQARPGEFLSMEQAFSAMGKASFDARKKFMFNEWRKEFRWKEEKRAEGVRPKSAEEAVSLSGQGEALASVPPESPATGEAPPEVRKAPPMKLKIPLKKQEPEEKREEAISLSGQGEALASVPPESPATGETPPPEVRKAPPMKLKIPLKKQEPEEKDRSSDPPGAG